MPIQAEPDRDDRKRRKTMELLAQADEAMLGAAWDAIADRPEFSRVRGPETGLIMLRGRVGGGGSPFNLGEASVSRATVRLASGEIGHGHTLGLSHRKAELCALFDALSQRAGYEDAVSALLAAVADDLSQSDEAHKRRTAATKVDFFTMVRGED